VALRPPILYGKLQAGYKCCYKMQQPESRCAMTAQRFPPKVPYKMQNPEVRSSRNRNFGNNMEALQNAKPGAFFFMKKWCWYKMHGPGRLPRTIFGPNLLCSKPGLTYFVGEIQTPMKTHHFTICRWFVRWKPCIFHIELSTFARQGTSSQHIPARLMGELMLQWIQ